jgi:hypothetical protein
MAALDFLTLATVLGTWVLVAGTLAFAYWQLRQAQRLHSATTILDLRERYYSPRMRQARRELSTWLLKEERGEEIENWEVGTFFELLGFLTRNGALERRMVWNAFGTWITGYYTFIKRPVDLFQKWRGESNDPLIFAQFEWLAKLMFDFDRSSVPGSRRPSSELDDARYILDSETKLMIEGGLPP